LIRVKAAQHQILYSQIWPGLDADQPTHTLCQRCGGGGWRPVSFAAGHAVDGRASRRKFVLGIVFLGVSRWPPQIVIRYPAMSTTPLRYAAVKKRRPIQWYHWIPLGVLMLIALWVVISAALHWHDPKFWDL